jgi:hypothetical protein
MMVGCPTSQLEEFVEYLSLHGCWIKHLVGAPFADRLL